MRDEEVGPLNTGFPPLLLRFMQWIVALTGLSIAYSVMMTYVFKKPYPYGMPLIHYFEPYWDFTVFHERFLHFRTASFWDAYNFPLTYPAPLGVVFEIFYSIPHGMLVYFAVLAASLVMGGWLLIRELVSRGASRARSILFTICLLATSWPLWYLFNRANIEGLVAIFLAAGVLLVLRERWWLGAALIGIAGAMKIFPLVLLALLLSKRRYKEFAFGILVTVVVTLGSLEILGPNILEANRQISSGLLYFERVWTAHLMTMEVGFDHSLFAIIKIAVFGVHSHLGHLSMATHPNVTPASLMISADAALLTSLRIYFPMTAVFGMAVYFLQIRKLPLLNQVLALTICAVLLPPVSYDYTLVQLLLPFGLLCVYATDSWRSGRVIEGLKICFGCFILIFTAEAYITVRFRLAGEVRAIALLVLLITVLRYPFAWTGIRSGEAWDSEQAEGRDRLRAS